MKKILLTILLLVSVNSAFATTPGDAIRGITSIMNTTSQRDKNKAYIRNMDAQTECIKNGKCTVINNNNGLGQTYDPNSADGKMADFVSGYFERKGAKDKLKEVKELAKIENDTKTLEIIKKYKKAGPIVTLQKIEESKK